MVSTTPAMVRGTLQISPEEEPSSEDDDGITEETLLDENIDAAESFVKRRLGGHLPKAELNMIATLVAADMVFPRVSGEAKGKMLSSAQQGSRSVSYANSQADSATGNSTHWQEALKLDTTGRLDGNDLSFSTTGA